MFLSPTESPVHQRVVDPDITGREVEPGVHRVWGLQDLPYQVFVRGAGITFLERERLDLSVDHTLWVHSDGAGPEGSVAVTAFDDEGKPWRGAEVALRAWGMNVTQETDENGACRFEGVPEGSATIVLLSAGQGETPAEFVFEKEIGVPATATAQYVLGSPPASETLIVEARDRRGRLLEGLEVAITGAHEMAGFTDTEGRVVFSSIPPGGYGIGFRLTPKAGWSLQPGRVLKAEGEHQCRLTVGTTTVRGRIVVEDGVGVRVTGLGDDRLCHTFADDDGSFEFPMVLPGKFLVIARGFQGGALRTKTIEVNVPEEGDVEMPEVSLDRPCTLWIAVAQHDGRPARGARVSIHGPGGATELERLSTGERVAEFRGLVEAGAVRVVVSIPKRGNVERVVMLEESEEKRVEVVVPE